MSLFGSWFLLFFKVGLGAAKATVARLGLWGVTSQSPYGGLLNCFLAWPLNGRVVAQGASSARRGASHITLVSDAAAIYASWPKLGTCFADGRPPKSIRSSFAGHGRPVLRRSAITFLVWNRAVQPFRGQVPFWGFVRPAKSPWAPLLTS